MQAALKTNENTAEKCAAIGDAESKLKECGLWIDGSCYRGLAINGQCEQIKLPVWFYVIPSVLIVINVALIFAFATRKKSSKKSSK